MITENMCEKNRTVNHINADDILRIRLFALAFGDMLKLRGDDSSVVVFNHEWIYRRKRYLHRNE